MSHYETILPVQLKQLKLSSLKSSWQEGVELAQKEGWCYERYLSYLCNVEIVKRGQRRLERRMKESGLPKGKTLGAFDFSANESIRIAQINALAENDSWVNKASNIIIFGPSGVGKTHLAAALGYRQLELGKRVKFMRVTNLLQTLQKAKEEFILKELLMKLDRIDLLILDDMSYVKKDEAETSLLFELICHRYEISSLIITANQAFSEWDFFPNNAMAVAAIDRLVHHGLFLNLSGKSYRVKDKVGGDY